jgi:hypothetical protein
MDDSISIEELIETFKASVAKNGKDYPLTLGHFLNILKVTQKRMDWQQSLPDIDNDPNW